MPGRVFDPQRYEQTYLANRRLRVSISGTAMQAIRPGHMLTRSARGSLLPSKRRPAERSGDGRLGCCRRLVKELGERNSDTGQLTRIDVQAGHSPVDLACQHSPLTGNGNPHPGQPSSQQDKARRLQVKECRVGAYREEQDRANRGKRETSGRAQR